MSIPLPALLGLSHDLALARKRRLDWELDANARLRGRADAGRLDGEKLQSSSPDVEAAEMQLLSASLASRGLEPRAPDAELAMLNLLTASFRSAKVARRETKEKEGTDFDWMVMIDVAPARAERSQGYFDTLCPAKGSGKEAAPDDRLAQICDIGHAGSSDEDADDVFCSPADLLNTEVVSPRRGRAHPPSEDCTPAIDETCVDRDKQAAMDRLRTLLRAAAASTGREVESEYEPDYDSDFEIMEDVSREALLEAEREELAQILAPAARCRDVESEFEAKCSVSV